MWDAGRHYCTCPYGVHQCTADHNCGGICSAGDHHGSASCLYPGNINSPTSLPPAPSSLAVPCFVLRAAPRGLTSSLPVYCEAAATRSACMVRVLRSAIRPADAGLAASLPLLPGLLPPPLPRRFASFPPTLHDFESWAPCPPPFTTLSETCTRTLTAWTPGPWRGW